ncbi:Transposon Tf2-11 polyprotein [Zancudomyces culisetae]|uniref:Transposon Tf2-11 polyprotein n=1 Tax=Zancudomyces culisetae TaxID=1213189 RepID=A0A1R1PHF4_ZANCU|nr:Transposon Tf2-11 polyprotein [Zancudomyces culisetae]|eukprot:OMH80343.1 Transposon Tf2-11 polyprotein [Zancudomyces culisetae]
MDKVTKFESGKGINAEDWIDDFQLIAKINKWAPEDWVGLVKLWLGKSETIWYKRNKKSFTTWDVFAKEFRKKFSNVYSTGGAWNRLGSIKRTEFESLEELEMELEKLWEQVGIKEEETKIGSLVSTFSDEIRERLSDKEELDREQVLTFVTKMEQSKNGRGDTLALAKSSKPATKNAATRAGKTVKELTTESGQFGEFLKTFQELSVSLLEKLDKTVAPKKEYVSQSKVERASAWECYYCHEKGHRRFECPLFQKEHAEKKVNFLDMDKEITIEDEVLTVEKRKAVESMGRVGRPAKVRNTRETEEPEVLTERSVQPEFVRIDKGKKFNLREELEKVYPKISMIQLLHNSEKIAQEWKNIVEVGPNTALNEIRLQEKTTTNCSMSVEIYQQQWKAVVDTGAACSVVTTGALLKIGLEPTHKSSHVIITADGKRHETLGIVTGVPIMISRIEFVASLVVLGNKVPTLILGMDWLLKHKANLNLGIPELRLPVDRAEVVTPLVTTKATPVVEEEWDLYLVSEAPIGTQGKLNNGIVELLEEYDDLFVEDIDKLKQTNVAEHKIVLTDNRPIKQRPYRIPFRLQEEVGLEIDRMLEQKVIAPSNAETDHKALLNMFNGEELSGRLARWAMFLRNFEFDIVHIAGKVNPADHLSRSGIHEITEDEHVEVFGMVYSEESLVRNYLLGGTIPREATVELVEKIKKKAKYFKVIDGVIYKWVRGKLKEVLTEAESIELVKKVHEETHEGIENTWARVSRDHYSKGLYRQVADYVKRCHTCQTYKDGRTRKHGLNPVHAVRPFEVFDKNNWDRYLWKVLLTMRTMNSKSTGYTPAEMLYGTELQMPSTWKTNGIIEDDVEQIEHRLKLMQSDLPQIRKIGVRKAVAAKEAEKIRYNKTVKPTKFQVGNKVLKVVEYDRGKLESLWEGPFTIIKRFSKGAYLITDQLGNRDLVNGDLLKLYHESRFMIPEITSRLRPKLNTFKQARYNEDIIA